MTAIHFSLLVVAFVVMGAPRVRQCGSLPSRAFLRSKLIIDVVITHIYQFDMFYILYILSSWFFTSVTSERDHASISGNLVTKHVDEASLST
jgi:hypothetical protein